MASIDVNWKELANAGNDVGSISKHIGKQKSKLDSQAKALQKFDGEAYEIAATALLSYANSVEIMKNRMSELSDAIKDIAKLYETYDERVSNVYNKKKIVERHKEFVNSLGRIVDEAGFFGKVENLYLYFKSGDLDLSGLLDFASSSLGTIATIWASGDFLDAMVGVASQVKEGAASWSQALTDGLSKFSFAAAEGFGEVLEVAAKWVGVAVSALLSVIDNGKEFNWDLTNKRFWEEAIFETAFDFGLNLLICSLVSCIPVVGPVIAPFATVGIRIGLDAITKSLTKSTTEKGVDFTEWVSDLYCDAVDSVVDPIFEPIQTRVAYSF